MATSEYADNNQDEDLGCIIPQANVPFLNYWSDTNQIIDHIERLDLLHESLPSP
ncbi:hypothetical protein HCG51_31720 [Tolypothrix sp. PCC 7910]|uniref:hypothetical protein n=1 Tax=Tolypothrix sp. PCC 7910 TaxID=2099387 RepID=UPI00142777D4|nr:hypothetical protein [Tolypothrix sp. PCC 7910]QIR40809.1 hypothetical protein HCG51_31720 [Tolypothrix sp. PCC 7910]